MSERREFKGGAYYDASAGCWVAQVSDIDAAKGIYWSHAALTRAGALFAAHRMARKFRRLDRRGLLR